MYPFYISQVVVRYYTALNTKLKLDISFSTSHTHTHTHTHMFIPVLLAVIHVISQGCVCLHPGVSESLTRLLRIIGMLRTRKWLWRFKKTKCISTVWGAKVNTGFLCRVLFPVLMVISRAGLFCASFWWAF